MKPFNNYILFKPFETDSISSGGIIVPDSYKGISNKGEIVAVGEGTSGKPMRLKAGMIGYRVKDWGAEIIENGIKYFLMEDTAILALEDNGIEYDNSTTHLEKKKIKRSIPEIKKEDGKVKFEYQWQHKTDNG